MRHVPAAQPSLWMNLRGVERGEKNMASSVTFHRRPSYLRRRPLALRPRLATGLPFSVLGLLIYCPIGTTQLP